MQDHSDTEDRKDVAAVERMSSSDLRYIWMVYTASWSIKSRATALRQFVESLEAIGSPVHQKGDYKFLWKTLLQDFHPDDAVEILKKLPNIGVTGGELTSDGKRRPLSAVWRKGA
jgi:hypothetical protein